MIIHFSKVHVLTALSCGEAARRDTVVVLLANGEAVLNGFGVGE